MSREYETHYEALSSLDEEENELPYHEANVFIHEAPNSGNTRWNHVEDLDDFFTRVYHFHQRHGFACMVIEDLLQLVQFVFIVMLSTFLFTCVDYPVLFGDKLPNVTRKVTIPDVIKSHDRCVEGFTFPLVACLCVAASFWLFRLAKVVYNMFKYYEIRAFYCTALNISSADIPNMTWHEVQRSMLDVQKDLHMCIHKQELTELDIYHRILRFKNYMVAMVNKSVLEFRIHFPFIGKRAYLSNSLKYNLEMILFWGPLSVFENNWHLKDVYKQSNKRHELARSLSRVILWIGLANFVFSPIIFLWQILWSFFRYGELIKREPGMLGSRRWTEYGRLQLRHFNELDHEFRARLNRSYKPATAYLDIFTHPLLVVLAKNVAFFAGAILATLIVLTVIDEDVLTVEHILTTMTIAGVVVSIARVCIPDNNAVHCPEQLLMNVLAHVHYMPDHWRGHAHTELVREQFSHLFNYKAVYLLEELFSPFVTPFVLCFSVRHRALDIVDFFRNFTVDVVGVGDVCSFAQMDVRRHGHPQWKPSGGRPVDMPEDEYMQAEEGKTELSLMHFHMTNPEWLPPATGDVFINTLKEQAQHDAGSMMSMTIRGDNPVLNSLASLHNPTFAFSSLMSSTALRTPTTPSLLSPLMPAAHTQPRQNLRGAVSSAEGPLSATPSGGLLTSVHSSDVYASLQHSGSLLDTSHLPSPYPGCRTVDDSTLEFLSADMSFSALYMHELRHRRLRGHESPEDQHARALWQRTDSTTAAPMPGIHEECEEFTTAASSTTAATATTEGPLATTTTCV